MVKVLDVHHVNLVSSPTVTHLSPCCERISRGCVQAFVTREYTRSKASLWMWTGCCLMPSLARWVNLQATWWACWLCSVAANWSSRSVFQLSCISVSCCWTLIASLVLADDDLNLLISKDCRLISVLSSGGESSWSGPWHIGSTLVVFHVHSYQHQFIQPGWAECFFVYLA